MTEQEELEMLELIDSIPQPPAARIWFDDGTEVRIWNKAFIDYIKEVAPHARFYDTDRMKLSDWNELIKDVDLSGLCPPIRLIPPPKDLN
ncbi:hypothetical protein ATE92_1751 [Ulvibacter sp. MAR_2010_11]|uniref:hypothetical protein n=1 Tax=Ulvibacter sp. MAR_2010_11 TaxID=1250229 RepID=UPI000C2C4D53|nr:hypothetical protein [Ulvibacter sp. MAR_2010_11]PKA83594.1 hypothetical protein ATE92_1751 [Ulvibacter sp. MAR_2010_11]